MSWLRIVCFNWAIFSFYNHLLTRSLIRWSINRLPNPNSFHKSWVVTGIVLSEIKYYRTRRKKEWNSPSIRRIFVYRRSSCCRRFTLSFSRTLSRNYIITVITWSVSEAGLSGWKFIYYIFILESRLGINGTCTKHYFNICVCCDLRGHSASSAFGHLSLMVVESFGIRQMCIL